MEARLVVVTDGRGNVPLATSREGEPPVAAGRRGLEDALAVAERLHSLPRVTASVVHPERDAGGELPHTLARALGADVVGASA
jgi:magnesium chelatase subunit D